MNLGQWPEDHNFDATHPQQCPCSQCAEAIKRMNATPGAALPGAGQDFDSQENRDYAAKSRRGDA
jgi:hypothetical protein